MPGTHSRRTVTLFGTIVIALALWAPAAGAGTDPDCEDGPVGIGCGPGNTTTTESEASENTTTTTERESAVPGEPSTTTTTEAAPSREADDNAGEEQDVDPVADIGSDDGGISPLFALAAGILGLGAGFAGGAAVMAARRQDGGTAAPAFAAGAPGAVGAGTGPGSLDGAQRGRLVHELINVRDQVSSEALKASIGATLAEVGVSEMIVTPGAPFDPQRHKGVDRIPTTDPALDRLVAETERPGYVDRDQVLRLPEVVVHRLDGQEPTT